MVAYLTGSLNRYASVFGITLRKRRIDIQELIGDDYSRVIICDRAAQYDAWFNRQLCWAHVLRTFDFLAESYGSRSLGAELAGCARFAKASASFIEVIRQERLNTKFKTLRMLSFNIGSCSTARTRSLGWQSMSSINARTCWTLSGETDSPSISSAIFTSSKWV